MRLRRLSLATVALTAGTLAVPAAGQAAACPVPGKIAFDQTRLGAVTVSWTPTAAQRSAGSSFRVLRGRAVVGQTTKTSMLVRGRPGRRITVKVGVVGPGGSDPRCYAARKVRVRADAPAGKALGRPTRLAVRTVSDRRVVLSWRRVKRARAYRISRDGRVAGQTSARSYGAAVTPGRKHAFTVVAVGVDGRLGRRAAIRFDAAHRAPAAPGALAASVVTSSGARIQWQAASPGSAPVRAYRVARNGVVIGQYGSLQADVTRLAHDRQYELSVAAVDARGVVGPASTITVRTTMPVPSTGKLQAFLLASTGDSFAALGRHYDRIGVVYPTYFDCLPADPSQIKGKDDPMITRWIKDRRIEILPRFNCQRPQTLRAIFTNFQARQAVIDRLVALANEHDYDGINLDFEAGAPQDRDSLSAFVADLAAALHSAGRKLAVDVSPKVADVPNHPRSTFYDYRAIAQHADWVWVMSWGLHWQTSKPGPLAPANWLTKVYDYVATQPDKHKFVMGLPLYGFDWPAGGGTAHPATARTYAEIQQLIARYGAHVRRDATSGESTFTYTDEQGIPHEVWFGDGASIAERFGIAGPRGLGGLGVWRLGQEDVDFWSQPSIAR